MVNLDLPSPPPPKKQKLGGYDFYRSIGSPKYVVAPMVDQSELAWRMLSRSPLPSDLAGPSVRTPEGYVRHPGGAHLCYTPMIHAKVFCQARGADGQFDLVRGEEGSADLLAGIEGGDRPLFVQFCANDPEVLLEAAKKVEKHCDAVDINFGCPQGIAKRGRYGAFLQDDWELIKSLIGTLHENLSIPVTAKFRIFPDLERTLAYARMMEAAGAQILTCHGRTREMKGQATGLADWQVIKAVKAALKIPVFANGNLLYAEDVEKCLEVTGCDGVMTAEGNLSNPSIFLPPSHPHVYPPLHLLGNRYLDIVSSLRTPTASSAIKAHLFRLFKPVLDSEADGDTLRIQIARCHVGPDGKLDAYYDFVREIERRIAPEMAMAQAEGWRPPAIDEKTGYRTLPRWVAQPYIRKTPVGAEYGVGEAEDVVEGDRDEPPRKKSSTTAVVRCGFGDGCSAVAALRCTERSCIVHCRATRATAAGMDADVALREAVGGGLVGKGCEAHEEKERARKERRDDKRERRAEGRRQRRGKKREYERWESHKGAEGEAEPIAVESAADRA